jgi:peptide deformylase
MKIVQYPHPALRQKAEPVSSITRELHIQVGTMLDLMYTNEGLGLAAPQVDLPIQVLVMNFSGKSEQKDQEFVAINPVIVEASGKEEDREGCLSFPGLFQKIRRAKSVRVQAYNLDGQLYEMECTGLSARVWQHEIDHLNGVLFIDKMGTLARLNSKRALEDYIAEFELAKENGKLPSTLVAKY